MSQDNITLNAGTGGPTVAADILPDSSHAQQIKILDGTAGSTNAMKVNTSGEALVHINSSVPISVTAPTMDSNSGSLTTTGGNLVLTPTSYDASVIVQITGTWAGTIYVQGTVDGTNWYQLPMAQVTTTTQAPFIQTTTNGLFRVDATNYYQLRTYFQTRTSGTAVVVMYGSNQQMLYPLNGIQSVAVASTVTQAVAGDTASGATDAGNPVKIGSKALNAVPTSVTTAQRVNALVDTMGRMVTTPQLRQGVLFKATTITTTTATTIIPAVASTFNDLTQLTLSNGSASATVVTISDGTNTLGLFNVPAGGGIVMPFPTPVSQTTVNTNWTATCSVAVSSLYVSAVYQTSK